MTSQSGSVVANDQPFSREKLSFSGAVGIVIGIVIGAGIFRTPSLVAANAGNELAVVLLWLAGGVVSLIGALCYAELATTYPHSGGDYHFLYRSFGYPPAFLFAWARITVIQTGSIAMMAFLAGDYATAIADLGPYSSTIYAALTVIVLTAVNTIGIRPGSLVNLILAISIVLGLIFVVLAGWHVSGSTQQTLDQAPSISSIGALGSAMIFVLLTYGGWNEAAYLSAEVRQARRNMARVLMTSIALITFVYVLVNIAMVRGLGLEGMAQSKAVAADLMRGAMGQTGARIISALILIAAISTINGTMITGARTAYALGNDFSLFRFLGRWRERGSTPANALLVQGVLALALLALGTAFRRGFETMVEYTAPVFWLFFLLVGLSLFVLRHKDPHIERPFKVPLYPLTPMLFCVVCAFMLTSSLAYTGKGALVGVAVLLAGVPFLLFRSVRESAAISREERNHQQ